MESEHGTFSVKLSDLEQEYDRLRSQIRFLQRADGNQLREERKKIEAECHAQDLLLEHTVETCRSPAEALLAGLQWTYGQQLEHILRDGLPKGVWRNGKDDEEDRAEAVTLYAEYAIDFAVQAIRQALIAVLTARELQDQVEHLNEEEEGGDDSDE